MGACTEGDVGVIFYLPKALKFAFAINKTIYPMQNYCHYHFQPFTRYNYKDFKNIEEIRVSVGVAIQRRTIHMLVNSLTFSI